MKIKGFFGFFSILLILASCKGSNEVEVGQKTMMEVSKVYEAGKVIMGEKVDAEFVVKNTGDYPLIISDVKGGCTCTVVEKPSEPILPGEEFTIRAYVNTDNVSIGAMQKPVTITANTEPSTTQVIIKAMVMKK